MQFETPSYSELSWLRLSWETMCSVDVWWIHGHVVNLSFIWSLCALGVHLFWTHPVSFSSTLQWLEFYFCSIVSTLAVKAALELTLAAALTRWSHMTLCGCQQCLSTTSLLEVQLNLLDCRLVSACAWTGSEESLEITKIRTYCMPKHACLLKYMYMWWPLTLQDCVWACTPTCVANGTGWQLRHKVILPNDHGFLMRSF